MLTPTFHGRTSRSTMHAFVLAVGVASASNTNARARKPLTDPMRVNSPEIPFALEPLQWGTVRPQGWIKDWAVAAMEGSVSPEHAAFAHVHNGMPGVFQQGTIGNEKNGGVSGWRDGRPAASGFWDEDSAYWIDGMVRLGLVLNDTTLVARASQDYAATLANPISFHNTWKSAHDLSSGSAEGWVRSVYSRGMLAYYDATGNKDILNFIVNAFSNYTAASSTSDRSLTQIEALFEGHAYGGPRSMVDTALAMMETNPTAVEWFEALNSDACLDPAVLDPGRTLPSAPAPAPSGVCAKTMPNTDLNSGAKGSGVVGRLGNVDTVGECCNLCYANPHCAGYVHCPSCSLNIDLRHPDEDGGVGGSDRRSPMRQGSAKEINSANCFLIGGPIHGTHPTPSSGPHARTSGILRNSTPPAPPSPSPPQPPSKRCDIKNTHGVTFNELAKLFAMAYSWNGNKTYLNTSLKAYQMLEKYDLQVHGVNSAQEQLSGISPNVGTETCNIVDYSYSNIWLMRITGDGRTYGDRLEKAFHNAAPGAINRTFSGHVYHQSPNLVGSSLGWNSLDVQGDHAWRMQWFHMTPCCTGNQARLLPNYIHHMWFGTVDGGLAATMYGPNKIATMVRGGVAGDTSNAAIPIEIVTATNYPFEDEITLTITSIGGRNISASSSSGGGSGGDGAHFPLLLRIPAWCARPTLRIAGAPYAGSMVADVNGFVRVERTWLAGDTIVLVLPAEIRATRRLTFADGVESKHYNEKEPWMGQNTTSNLPFCVIERGPLTYALPMEQDPYGPYNFAVACDPSTMSFSRKGMPTDRAWDWPLDAPLTITVQAKPFRWPDVWRLPDNPVSQNETTGPLQTLTLVPYGNVKVLKVSMFPLLEAR